MGVHGLWKLLEAAGKPVPLETLENKVLAVDVSIWLHQMMKGFQDSRGAPLPNAHLLGLFHRVCKLLFYRIKPVFVFDGGVPLLKKQTIAARRRQKKQASESAADAKAKLLMNLVKRKAVRQLLQGSTATHDNHVESESKDDMFQLPPLPSEGLDSDSGNESRVEVQLFMESSASDGESEPEIKPSSQLIGHKLDLHTLDVHSEEFCSLPPDVRHDILTELKETRKQNSWGRLHEMPEESGEFSNFQLGRLLKRHNVQCAMEKAEKEMGGKVMRINELQELMAAQGVNIVEDIESASQRIASDSSTRYILCKDKTGQSFQNFQSSSGVAEESGENPLVSEQVEFISRMAESMVQQIEKKTQAKKNSKEEENHLVERVLNKLADEIAQNTSKGPSIVREKVFADSWSSDEEESNIVSQELSPDVMIVTSVRERSPKRKVCDVDVGMDSFSELSPASKISKVDADDMDTCGENSKYAKTDSFEQSSGAKLIDPKKTPKLSPSSTCSLPGNSEEKCSKEPSVSFPVATTIRQEPLHKKIQFNDIQEQSSDESDGLEETVKHQKMPLEDASNNIEKCVASSSNFKEVDKLDANKKPLEIVIQPDIVPDNDIFADVFQNCFESKEVSENGHQNSSSKVKSIEIVVQPGGKPGGEDIYSDIFHSSPERLESIDIQDEASSESESDVLPISEPGEAKKDGQQETKKSNTREESSTSISPSSLLTAPTSSTDWNEVEASLEAEQLDLQKESGRQERLAASITDQMCSEAQDLLKLFGLPYIIAPLEAEAQCAYLDAISLTEGSITDDSDIWLFGGKKVYKNFFNQKKHVLQFTSANLNHYFKLTREQLVQLALLVGSDYTTGIQGVGPVTALEIVAAFKNRVESDPVQCTLEGLSQFRNWWDSGRPHRSNHMRLLDKKLRNLKFSEGFPSQAVVEAYLRPSVDDSQETFSWGALDLPALREYTKSKFGWTAFKTDEILLPVVKKWTSRSSQRSIDSYFNFQPLLVEGLGKMSKRVQSAVTLMDKDEDGEEIDDPAPIAVPRAKKQRKKQTESSRGKVAQGGRQKRSKQDSSDGESDDDGNDELPVKPKIKRNQTEQAIDELPVRAPTVPRQRSSTGVKRVGRMAKPSAGPTSSNAPIDSPVGEPDVSASQKTSSPADVHRVRKPGSNTSKARAFTPKHSEISSDSDNLSDTFEKMGETPVEQEKSFPKLPLRTSSTMNDTVATPGPKALVLEGSQPRVCTGPMDELGQMPSSSREEAAFSSDLLALSEMDWEDDPWSAQPASSAEPSRPKLYFGGIRPNRPRKPTRRAPVVAAAAAAAAGNNDSRGVRPGWLTRERLESRTPWISTVHEKKEEAIPQREQDQRAMEDAKMKAIAVIKASEARQASRLLGRQPSRRGKGKAKPTRKILPEHNLSESSSDE